jgi:hypothetical protein
MFGSRSAESTQMATNPRKLALPYAKSFGGCAVLQKLMDYEA